MIELDYSFIYTKYWLEDPAWSLRDLANYYNTYQAKISRFMKKHDIPVRTMSEGCKESWKCPIHRENHIKSSEEFFKDPQNKKRMLLNLKLNPNTLKGKNHPHFGKKHSEETKEKMRISALNRRRKS